MSLKEDIQNILRKCKDTIHGGNNERAAKALGVNAPTFWRWLSGKNVPRVETLEPVFEALHATITLPGREPEHQDLARDVCFVDAKVVPAGDGLPPVASEDYLAVPLVDEMDADHVTAWSKGGSTSEDNCQMLCKTHNRVKGNR